MMRKLIINLSLFFALFLPALLAATPHNVYLSAFSREADRQALESFGTRDAQTALEIKKIQYLLSRIESSSYHFIRNGTEYSGRVAYAHLRRKYAKVMSRIATAEQFIDKIATRSFLTGQPYLIKVTEDEIYPASEVLYNELDHLESLLTIRAYRSPS